MLACTLHTIVFSRQDTIFSLKPLYFGGILKFFLILTKFQRDENYINSKTKCSHVLFTQLPPFYYICFSLLSLLQVYILFSEPFESEIQT